MKNPLWLLASFAFALSLLAFWQLVSQMGWVSRVYLPSPVATFDALVAGFESGPLIVRSVATVERMIYGWFFASLAGVVIGSVIGSSREARAYLLPMLEYLRPMPAAALIPVMIPILGLTNGMILFVTAFAALWPTLLGTIHGFSAVDDRLTEVARVLRLSRLAYIFKIALPNAMPDILAGMRLSLTYALILAVVGEMLTGREGLGSWILNASRFYQAPNVFAGAALLGLVGYLTTLLMNVAERRILRWRVSR